MAKNLFKGSNAGEVIVGSNQADLIFGFGGDDTIIGGDGQDILSGGHGNDRLEGGNDADILSGDSGDDTLIGDRGDDLLIGGAGNDRLIWNNGDGSDTMRGGAGQDVVEVNGAVGAGDQFELRSKGDRVDFRRVNLGLFQLDIDDVERMEINGGGGDDSLLVEGLSGTDLKIVTFNGGDGNDTLMASDTDISIVADGGDGDDILYGGSANDILIGGKGNNRLAGGLGADIFRVGFDGIDVIQDFNVLEGDILQIQATTSLGSADMRNALAYNAGTGALSVNGAQIATLTSPVGGFDMNQHVEILEF